MPSVDLKGNWRKSPSWYDTNWKEMNCQKKRSGREGDDWRSSSSATDEKASKGSYTDVANHEICASAGPRNLRKKVRYLKVSPDDLWPLKEKLDGKKSSLRKTYKANKETNDKVYELNRKMSRHLETLALLYRNFDAARDERKEAVEQFDKDFQFMLEKIAASRSRCVAASENFNKVETNLNEGLELIYEMFQETEVATRALTCGTEARGDNEIAYLQEVLDILSGLLRRESHEGYVIEEIEEVEK